MRVKVLLAGLIVISVCGVSALPATASTPKPTIASFSPTSATAGAEVTIKGTNLAGATRVTFNGMIATVISDTATKINAEVPTGATTGYITVKTPGGRAKGASEFAVLTPLDDVMDVVSGSDDYCALLTSGGVDCWGYGEDGELGNGTFYSSSPYGSAVPVAVEGVGGTGTLTGVTSLVGGTFGYCALLISGGVDCWGYGEHGDLGNGTFYTSSPYGSATPVVVEGVGGTGTLAGVRSLVADIFGYCALLTSGGVDCWGYGSYGELGNGAFSDSASPVVVEGVGGTGTLAGVRSLVADGFGDCALLTSGGVDCWGVGEDGALGNGTFSDSATPVVVKGVGAIGTLTGVTSLVGDDNALCALLTSGRVDCWGYGEDGELGNGTFYTSSPYGSAIPVVVEGVGGSGTLTGVTSLVGDSFGYCALLTSGGVDCWGYGEDGELGNGIFYTSSPYGSATPVFVKGVEGTGTLTGVTSLVGESGLSTTDGITGDFCALLTSGGVDCWGYGSYGELGNGTFYTSSPYGSAIPVVVEGVGGTGTLTGVTSLMGGENTFCTLLTSGGVDCWGFGADGQLGDGTFYRKGNLGSATAAVVG